MHLALCRVFLAVESSSTNDEILHSAISSLLLRVCICQTYQPENLLEITRFKTQEIVQQTGKKVLNSCLIRRIRSIFFYVISDIRTINEMTMILMPRSKLSKHQNKMNRNVNTLKRNELEITIPHLSLSFRLLKWQ